ncbi:MAG: lipoxygenase family protein [Actinomycetota bacterium]
MLSSENPLTAARSEAEQFARERSRAENRSIYEWDRFPGLPPFCKGVPASERSTAYDNQSILAEMTTALGEMLLGWTTFTRRANRDGKQLEAYERMRPLGRRPAVADVWRRDDEFARQRLNGVNPLLIERVHELPAHLNVTDETVAGVLPMGTSLAQLRDEGRLYVCDWAALTDCPVAFGRFLTAPTALFWVDPSGTLMPLAIQLDRETTDRPDIGERMPAVVFTPDDDQWLWLTVRTHVQSADASYHEMAVHLLRTHLVMETVWVAANRGLARQHPIHRLLTPHFHGTIGINHKARNKLIVPGGPIDMSISCGSEGAYWLINQALKTFSFGDLDPAQDIERRGVGDRDVLPGYHYRDDALRSWELIGDYTEEVLRCFYPDDESVRLDHELADWVHELTDADCGALAGFPVENGRFQTFADLHHVVRTIVFTMSAGHSAVNNGQFDIYGHIPNSPGALFLPHPRTKTPSNEGELAYALPPFKVAATQIALVRALSSRPDRRLGDFPEEFFDDHHQVRIAVDRFRARLDELTIDIDRRNRDLEIPYTYLDPATAACSVNF